MDYGIIYMATNKSNGKVYIGMTSRSLNTRITEHFSRARKGFQQAFYHAIRKYGEENFDWEVIDTANNDEELNKKEVYWIEKYDSYNNGYNSSIGGDYNPMLGVTGENHPMFGKEVSEETRRKISESNMGKKHTEESKIKIGNSVRGMLSGENNPMFNRTYENHPRATPVVQLSLDNEFIAEYKTIREGAEAVGGGNSHIVQCCKGKLKTHKGFKWKYKEDWSDDIG